MKIKLNNTVNNYDSRDVRELQRRGFKFDFSASLNAYVPKPVKIHENGESRLTTLEELITRREAGERFLKVAGKAIYAPFDADKYDKLMRPIWAEDKREERELDCIYKGKPCCKQQNCEGCTHIVYRTDSISRMEENGDPNLPETEDVAETVSRKEQYAELYTAISDLNPTDIKILLLRAEGVSERDIAKAVGFKSKTSVVKRLAKFLPPLRQRLEKNF